MNIGRKIRALRLEQGLTQEDLAWKANVERSTISRIENDASRGQVLTVDAILKALGYELHIRSL